MIQPFLEKLNANTSADNMTFALPTEAQWEYACRAGTTKPYYGGESENDFRQYGWFDANSGGKTHPVGQLKPNAFGLYDLYGNVWEWCADWHAADYAQAPVNDPTGPSAGSRRVCRGGGWTYHPRYGRSATRRPAPPGYRLSHLGYRLAAVLAEE
jgi:formylglycine-generating enzyme required for sulfatase activity